MKINEKRKNKESERERASGRQQRSNDKDPPKKNETEKKREEKRRGRKGKWERKTNLIHVMFNVPRSQRNEREGRKGTGKE